MQEMSRFWAIGSQYIYIHILEFGKIHAQHMANIRGNGNCM